MLVTGATAFKLRVEIAKRFPSIEDVRSRERFSDSSLESVNPLDVLPPVEKWAVNVNCTCSWSKKKGTVCPQCDEVYDEVKERRRVSLGFQ